ncbi:MAG: valine--tRNA ligase [Hyphomicrobiaceae bacterium]|nr:valine--tRNA ligase [Hyphomicrobiaceae bacterium]
MLEKTYQPAEIEKRIYQAWESAGAFRAGRPERAAAKPYCIAIPPPNVTGSLHMGHALNNTLQDVLCRFERMRGKDVLWQPGTDHAGIATQMVVERKLAGENRTDRRTMGRQAFVAEVWKWKAESGGMILNQLKRLGASCDWSRERFTMDEGLSRAVIEVFVELYRKGLIYKDKRLVNWDPRFQSAISDLEVMQVEVKGHLWHLRYPLAEDPSRFIVVATTRPETMLGDTAVAVHPEDERYKALVGKTVVLPLVGRRIPIVADEHSDPEKGSGAVKITPAHDFNDFEVGRRHDLAMINVLAADATLNENAPEAYRGLDRFEARSRIVADLDALGLVEKIEPHTHAVPHGDRSNVPIEPWLTDQWYVNAAELAKDAIAAVEDGRTVFVPKNWEKTYFEWMRNIQPWCISRQLWWGHQIPAWYGPDGEIFVDETENLALAAAQRHYGARVNLERDPDVLDTWFSSALWPFSTLGWPARTPELERYYPTDVVVTGFDIIFFWVARMMMMGLHFQGEVPFRDIYIHALVRDEKGQKMSKSKGNIMDPLDLIDAYGADALRFTLAAMAAQGRDIKLARSRVEGYRNFATKLWNAARFAEMNECVRVEGFDPASARQTVNRWIAGETERTAKAVTAALEAYKFNEAASAVYEFTWGIFCDWYLELVKPVLGGTDEEAKAETRAMVAWTLDQVLKLLHPFMPFITEELWAHMIEPGVGRDALLALSAWPELDGLADPAAGEELGWVVHLVSEVRSVRAEMNVPAAAKVPLVLVGSSEPVRRRSERHQETIGRLARLSAISFEDAPPRAAALIAFGETTAALPLAGVIDMKAERARLQREMEKAAGDVHKIDAKLANAQFLAKAPAEVVDEQRERKAELEALSARLATALGRLED